MNASCTDQPRTSPVAFRTKSERSSYGAPLAMVAMHVLLSACQQEALHLLLAVEVDDGAQQVALLVRAAGINAQRSADSAIAAGLVDVAVEGERGLVLLDCLADGGRADRLHGAAGVLEHHVGGQLGGVVETGTVRRTGEAEDRALGRSGHAGDRRLEALAEVGLVLFAIGVPRRPVGPAGGDQLEAVHVDDAPLGELDVSRVLDDLVDVRSEEPTS